MSTHSRDDRSVLREIARAAMRAYGLEPDWPADAIRELAQVGHAPLDGLRDLRDRLGSSINNDESRDLDQLEVCADAGGGAIRLLVAIADVDALVAEGSAID